MNFTKEEMALLELTVDLWNGFLKLEMIHSEEQTEFRQLIHAIQSRILSRPGERYLIELDKQK